MINTVKMTMTKTMTVMTTMMMMVEGNESNYLLICCRPSAKFLNVSDEFADSSILSYNQHLLILSDK